MVFCILNWHWVEEVCDLRFAALRECELRASLRECELRASRFVKVNYASLRECELRASRFVWGCYTFGCF